MQPFEALKKSSEDGQSDAEAVCFTSHMYDFN